MTIDRPESSTRSSPRLLPRWRSSSGTLVVADHKKRPGVLPSLSRRDVRRFGAMLIELDEVTQRDGVRNVVGFGEGIESQSLFQPGDEDGNREGVEAGIE